MKLSTVIMVSALGGMLGATLGRVIGEQPTMAIAFILGVLVAYINEKYNKLF